MEVAPRDGLQNEPVSVSTDDKLKFIQLLYQAGLSTIEVASFVHPDLVPQMSDGPELFCGLMETPELKGGAFPVLIPNKKGLENALSVGASYFSLLTATSQTFSEKNINASVDESIDRVASILQELGPTHSVRVYISTAFSCPYEGTTSLKQLMAVVEKILALGVKDIVLGDTIGAAQTNQVDTFLREVEKVLPLSHLALHFHDTKGLALGNVRVGLERGVRIFDSSASGLGGCPYADGATGNVATEEVVRLMDSLGMHTGVDLEKLKRASCFIREKIKS